MLNPGMPVFGAALICLFLKTGRVKFILSFIGIIVSLFLIINLPEGRVLSTASFLEMELILAYVSIFTRNIGIIFALFALLVLIYAFHFLAPSSYILLNIFVGSSIAILFVRDYISFFLFWELISISAFFIIFDKSSRRLRFIAEYYIIIHILGGLSLLFGILLNYNYTGNIILASPENGLVFFLFAIAIKLGFVGVHTWIPRTYATIPFHLSVMMAAYTSKVGVYALYRIIDFESNIIAYFGVVNALAGVVLALIHSHLRLIISYSIVSQIGYMMVGIGLASPVAVTGGIFHIINHVLYKGLLFMMAGNIIYSSGQENLGQLGGLWKKIPVTFGAGMVASLSIAGFPFFNGYLSKAMIKQGIDSQILYYGLMFAGIGTSLVFIKVIYYTFLGKYQNSSPPRKPLNSMRASMVLLAVLIIFIAWSPSRMEQLFALPVSINYFSRSEIFSGLQPVIIAFLSFPLLKKYLKPHPDQANKEDIYDEIGQAFLYLDTKVSKIHSGDMIRYLSWALLALLFLLLYFLLLN